MSKKITDYELGNSVLYKLGDNCIEVCSDCRDSHPSVSKIISRLGEAFIKYGQGMEESDPSDPRHKKGLLSPEQLEEILKEDILIASN